LVLDALHSDLELSNFCAGFKQHGPKGVGKLRFLVLEQSAELGNHVFGSFGDEQTDLPEHTAHGVDASRPGGNPSRAQAMKGSKGVLHQGLDGNRVDLLVSMGFKKRLGVRSVVFASLPVGLHQVRREEDHLVPERLDLTPSGEPSRTPPGLQWPSVASRRTAEAAAARLGVVPILDRARGRRQFRRRSLRGRRR
jgi:hypothetical protein